MAKCEVCGKTPMFGNNVSHANNKTRKVFKANIKKIRARVNGSVKKINICTRCLRSGKVEKVL